MIDLAPFTPQPDLKVVRAVNAQLPQSATVLPVEMLRALQQQMRPAIQTDHTVETASVTGPRGEVPVRIIRPEGPPKAVHFSAHAGGWCLGSAADNDWLNDILAAECNVASVAIDYGLAPEHPYPAGLLDILAVIEAVAPVAGQDFGTDRLVISGASAGAHLAAQALVRLRDGVPGVFSQVAGAAFSYGGFDLGWGPSVRLAPPVLCGFAKVQFESFLSQAFPGLGPEERRDPQISPLYNDLAGLPPVLFSVGSSDPGIDDSLFMAARWRNAGGEAHLDIWPECGHGFDIIDRITGRLFAQRLSSWFNALLG